ncbi:energy transducer TonB, partial [Lysobacter maris]
MHRRECRFAILISIAVAVAGCSAAPEGPSTVAPAPAASSALEAAADTRIATLDSGGLRERATAALRERRIHAPAGDNAIEYYLALRERDPDDASVAAALVELQPYLLIAAEQALVRGENAESGRLLALMGRADPDAPALPRLREALREAERALAESKARAEAEA